MTELVDIAGLPEPAPEIPARFAAARSILESAVLDHAFPGASFGVLHRGQFYTDAVGHFTYDPLSPAVHPDTVYDIASVTKVVATTAMAMLLWQRGLLNLDRPVSDLLPGFIAGDAGAGTQPAKVRSSITIAMLLAHCSGLPAYARLFEQHRTPQSLIAACLALPLESPPLTTAVYSDIGFILLGLVLEQIAGQSIRDFTLREIFAPLGMAHTGYLPPVASFPEIAPTLDDKTFRYRIIQGRVHDENCSVLGGVSGHAGLFSTSGDLLRFAACILRSAAGEKNTLFRPETIRRFTTVQAIPAGTCRALGWDTPSEPSSSGRFFSPNSAGHLGYTGTSLWIDFDQQLAVVLLTNRTWPDNSSQAIKIVRPAFHDAIVSEL